MCNPPASAGFLMEKHMLVDVTTVYGDRWTTVRVTPDNSKDLEVSVRQAKAAEKRLGMCSGDALHLVAPTCYSQFERNPDGSFTSRQIGHY